MAETTYYVDVDVVGGAADGSSLANAYSSLNIAETARAADITAGNAVRFLCHNTLGGTDSTAVVFSGGWVTDADSYIKVEAASAFRHAGVWDASKYHIVTTDAHCIHVQEDYVRIDGIQTFLTVTANNIRFDINYSGIGAGNELRLSNLIIKGDGTGTGQMHGVYINDGDSIVKVWNCVLYGFISVSDPADTNFGAIQVQNCTSVDIWHCTINDNRDGIQRNAGTVTVDSCLIFENTDDFVGGITSINCASDDNDNGGVGDFQITQTADDYAALVVDADGRDYNVTDGASELVGAGTDDPGGATQDDTDIAGNARTSTWDIGAFELVVAVGAAGIMTTNTGFWGPTF